jgi:hypothetical protein
MGVTSSHWSNLFTLATLAQLLRLQIGATSKTSNWRNLKDFKLAQRLQIGATSSNWCKFFKLVHFLQIGATSSMVLSTAGKKK